MIKIGLIARCEHSRASSGCDRMSTMPPTGWKKPNPVRRPCSVEGCESTATTRGWCPKHYTRWKATGDPLAKKRVGRPPGIRRPCAISECGGVAVTRGLCPKHYARRRNHGSPFTILNSLGIPARVRFLRKVEVLPNGCWEWNATTTRKGYGLFHDGKMVAAHVWSFKHFVGPIPDGLQLDHLCHTDDPSCLGGDGCRHRRCVNPAHLEPVTARGNSLRGTRRSREYR